MSQRPRSSAELIAAIQSPTFTLQDAFDGITTITDPNDMIEWCRVNLRNTFSLALEVDRAKAIDIVKKNILFCCSKMMVDDTGWLLALRAASASV